MLIVEFEGNDEESIAAQLKALEEKVKTVAHQSIRLVPDKKDQAQLWATRSAATPLLFKRGDKLQPVPIVEDAAVPPEKLGLYLEKAGKVFEKYKLEWSAYAHAGSGEVHIRPMMDLHTKEHVDLLEKVAGEVHAAAWECDGTISGEHGEGLARAQWIEKQAGKELYTVYKEVKSLFDPSGLLNPNKKITADAHLMMKNLRFGPHYEFSSGERPKHWSIDPTQAVNYRMFKSQTSIRSEMTVEALAKNPNDIHFHGVSPLIWHGEEMAHETEKCNGCGHCRTTGPEEDMCPRFKYQRVEEASPRAKANLLRRLMSGRQVQGSFSNDEVIEIMDTCFNCKLCHDGCPSNVNIPKIVMEAKARYHQSHGLPLDKWFFTQSETWLANMLLDSTVFRFALEKIVGVDRRRPLPKIRTWKLRRRNTPSGTSDRPKVVLYLDLYPKYNAPELAQAAIDVLEHNGFEVEIPDVPWTNMPALENGAVMIARKQIAEIARVLAPYAFRGIPIVSIEPTAALCFKEEFLNFVDTPQTRALQRHSYEISEFLLKLHREKKLNTAFRTLNHVFGYNQACHQKALHIGTPGVELVRQIPGVSVVTLEEGCCGIAGTFGMLKKNHDESMFIGIDLFAALQDPMQGFELGMCESSTCRIQMEHGSGKQTLHPIQILANAYGYESAEAREDGWAQWDKPQPLKHDEHEHDHPVVEGEHAEHLDDHGQDEHAHDEDADEHHDSHDDNHEHSEHHDQETADAH
jgi:Fe-S oxidoreductase